MPIDINERIDATRRASRRRLNLDEITAVLGRNDTNAVANTRMPGRVWVSIYASNGLLGFRSALAPTKYFTLDPNTPVKLKYDTKGRLQVDEPDADRQLTAGVDPVGQATLQTANSTPQSDFETLRVIASDTPSLTVWVKAWKIYGTGLLYVFPGIDVDLTSYVPSTGNMLYAMIALESDLETIEVVTSTPRSIGDIDLNIDDENECAALLSAGSTPIWAIKLIGDQTEITQSDIDLDGQDERQLVNNSATVVTALSVTDGTTTVTPVTSINFTSGATVSHGGGGTANVAVTGGGGGSDFIQIQDRQTAGTNGGTFPAGSWQTRVLNTIRSDSGSHASLSSNQITLDAGTYEFEGSAPAFIVDRHQTRLYNVTDSIEIEVGTSEYSQNNTAEVTRSFVSGKFTIAAGKALALQHVAQTTVATYGLGVGVGVTTEVFAEIRFWKVA